MKRVVIVTGRGKPGSRAEVAELRLRLRRLGAPTEMVAAEIARRHGYRIRQALRLAHGWDQSEASERFNALVQAKGSTYAGRDTMTPSRVSEFERWPDSTRKPPVYVLGLLAELYGLPVASLLDAADLDALEATDRAALVGPPETAASTPGPIVVATQVDTGVTAGSRRRDRLIDTPPSSLEEFVIEAADQSGEAAELAQASNIGSYTVPMLERTVAEITRAYEKQAPEPLFRRAVAVRNRVLDLLNGRQPPAQTAQLYTVAGSVCALLAWMSGDFAQHPAALTQADAAWVFADQSGHDPVRALVRTTQAKTAYWAGDFAGSADYAYDGLRYASGTNAVLLAGMEARAHARCGRADETVTALRRAESARQVAGEEPGWLFGCSVIGQHTFAAGARLSLRDPAAALTEATAAETAYAALPEHSRSYNSITMARINATIACLQAGDLIAAADQLTPVTSVPTAQRLDTFAQRLRRATVLLGDPKWSRDTRAAALREQITAFQADSARRALPA